MSRRILRAGSRASSARRCQKCLRLARHKLRNDVIVKPRKKLPVARQIAAIEKRNREFQVIRIDAIAFAQRAARGTQLQAQIPKLLRESANRLLDFCFGLVPSVKEQKINIGIGEKPFSSVATERNEGEILRPFRIGRDNFAPRSSCEGIDQLRSYRPERNYLRGWPRTFL